MLLTREHKPRVPSSSAESRLRNHSVEQASTTHANRLGV
jgi:hypothetical protein